jgi:hypothetical protein
VAAILGLAGASLTNYAKARTAIEIAIENDRWPDLVERQERIIFLCALLILAGSVFGAIGLEERVLIGGLWLYAGLTHVTALQRARRAARPEPRHSPPCPRESEDVDGVTRQIGEEDHDQDDLEFHID